MTEHSYIVAAIHPWNIELFNKKISKYPGKWTLVTTKSDLNLDLIKKINPKYIFFPHWSYIVPKEILDAADCICFHTAKLPFGRGGSPIQNQIVRGIKETEVCALKMTEEVDAGPVYLRKKVSLEGLAEEIFIRISNLISEMIYEMITTDMQPQPQEGDVVAFERRTPEQSEVPEDLNLETLYDFLRMLDAEGYPRAFLKYGNYKLEFSKPVLRHKRIEAEVKIHIEDNDDE